MNEFLGCWFGLLGFALILYFIVNGINALAAMYGVDVVGVGSVLMITGIIAYIISR